MNCPACNHENRPGAKFCEECATALKLACASCGAELRPTARFCDECAAPTGTPARPAASQRASAPVDARKVVSIVFADLVGSTALHERLEPESARRFMESYYDAMRGAVESHGGTVTQLLGDGVKAVFGIPRVAEDDAIRAVRAAVAMQEAFRALADARREAVGATGLRVAVNTGEVVANDATEIIGDPVNVAARLQEQGSDGDVVIGESTHRLVSTLVTLELLGSFALKGRSEAVKAYRVVSLDRPAGPATAPFVGRDEEWSRLSAVYETAVEKPAACLAVLVGSPGLGKSRLIDEFARGHADAATVVRAHCNAAGGTTFAPLSDAFRRLLGIESGASVETLRETIESVLPAEAADRARIANGIAALLAGAPPSPEETFFVVRRLLGALAFAKPVVLVIDDLHWAESLLLDLVEHLIQWGSGTALFVLIGARPELRDLRSSLVTPGGLVADVVTLAGLDAGAAMRLAANVIGASDLPAAIAAKVLATSEGNPLFVGELVRMLVQEGALTREGTRWTVSADLSALEMPPTIHALLAARIERLRPEERAVLERAAVVGRHFSRSAVAALMPHESSQLDSRLEALRRSELIERDTGWLLGEPVLRFHHLLIRDAAYRRLLKGTRAELHAKLADWIEAQTGDAPEHDETIGWHLEQAHAFLRELGPLDETGKRLGDRAATRLAAAGRRALAGDDVPLAAGLLGRAIERLDAEDPARADLALDWCEALLSAGDVVPAAAAIAELGRFAASDDRLRAWQTCFASQLTVLTEPQGLQTAADAVAAAAQQLTQQGDATGEAKAHSVHAQALARLGKVGACEAALDLALAAARRAGDRRRANAVLAGAPLAALWGPSPVTRASGRCLDVVRVLRITQGAPAVESVALSCQGVLEALRGRTDAARRMIASSRKMVEELGIASRLFEADAFAGRIEAMEGDTAAAERLLRGAYEGLRDLGLGIDAARAGALLARVLLAQDRGAEAEALTHESEALAGDDLQAAIAWRGVRAESLAKRGEHAAATTLAQAAVEIASATDALLDHADARIALAAALRAAGHGAEADAEERRARELWEAKGATLLAQRGHRAGDRVVPVADSAAEPIDARPVPRRRVRSNAASAKSAHLEAALAAGDFDDVRALIPEAYHEIDHATGSEWGRDGAIASLERLFRSRDPHFELETLATLGEELALQWRRTRASGDTRGRYDVGPYEHEALQIAECDARGVVYRQETFAADHLADAVVRLYERHAELLPEGLERERSAATARAFGAMLLAPAVSDRIATIIATDFESVDHRHLSLWSMRGGDAFLDHMRALHQVAADVVIAVTDVLAIGPTAVLIRRMHSGTDRVGGGAYERPFLVLFATDASGRLARAEWFDADRGAEALARFDALAASTSAAPPPPVRRRVYANEACAVIARVEAAFAARDAAALEAEFDESLAVIAHPTGTSYGRDGHLHSLLRLAQSRDPVLHFEPIATLGESLVLARSRVAASGATSARYDVGAYEREEFALSEITSNGRMIALEIFASDHLSDALVRLYARYAERLPEGPERRRAAATAGSVAAWSGPADLDRMAATVAPAFECADHRPFHTWSSHGRDEWLQHWRMWLNELIADQRLRDRDVLAIEPSAFLVCRSYEGIGRSDAGEYENRLLVLFAFDPDGLVVRVEGFEPDREAEALERFDALTTAHSKPGRAARRVQPNRATAAIARFDAACMARDGDAAAAQHREDFEETDHPTGSRYGLDGGLDGLRRLLRAHDPYLSHEPLATLGEGLLLARRSIGASATAGGRFDVGAWAREEWVVAEADEDERLVASEIFAHDRLGDAVMRLYERYAAQQAEGPACTRATAIALGVSILSGPIDLARFALAYAPDVRVVDHRVFATWSSESRAESLDHFRHQLDLAPDFAARIDGVLGIAPGGLVVSITFLGTSRDSGGAFENRLCNVMLFDDDGRMSEVQCFEAEQEAEALAHFEAMFGRAAEPARDPFENAAARADRLLFDRFDARDWPGIEALAAPDLVFDERRRMLRNTCGRDVWLEQFRVLFDVPVSRFTTRLLATRGERLSLNLHCFSGEVADGGGPLAMDDHLALHEVDRDGRITAIVLFDLEDEEAAHAELDARWEAGEAALHPQAAAWVAEFRRAFVSRDWDAMSALQAPDQVANDYRLVGWGTLRGAGAWTPTLRELVALAPDVRQRVDHLRVTERGHLWHHAWQGTRDGGEFENLLLLVVELDEDGREWRIDVWEADCFDAALARFEEISARAAPEGPFENTASRAWRAVSEAWTARDLERFAAPHAADLRYRDHRRLFELDLDRVGFLDFTRPLLTMRVGIASLDLVATRGERLALMHSVLRMEDETVGPSTIESLMLIEADEQGAITAYDRWDLEDEDAARDEIDARWEAGDGAQHPGPTTFSNFFTDLERRDWDAAAACYAPDFVGHDHRLVGWGTVHGPTFLVRALQEMVSLAPDVRMRSNHQRACARGVINDNIWEGTREGGAFESPFVAVTEHDADGRFVRTDFYDPHHLDRALARFEEIRASERRDPLAAIAKPNLASMAMQRNWATFDVLDLDAAQAALDASRAHYAPDFVWDDRRPLVGLTGDLDLMVASARERLASGARHERRTILGTAGDRVAIGRVLWAGGPLDGRFEVEFLVVSEVDEAGLFTAHVFFEPEDTRAAQREAWARWAAIDPVAAPWLALLNDLSDGWEARDMARTRAHFADDVVVEDHRHAGIGRIEGADAYLDSVVALRDLAPDQRIEFGLSWASFHRHGAFLSLRRVGTLPDGGAFESDYAVLLIAEAGRITRYEMFEIAALDEALARFEELRPDPLRIPETAATRLRDRHRDAFLARDWDAMRSLGGADFAFDDRGKRALVHGDIESWIASMEFTSQPGFRADLTLIGTLGDRIVLDHCRWFGKPGGDAFEFERVRLLEVGADGLLRAVLFFDPEDRLAVSIEGLVRFAAGEAAGSAGIVPLVPLYRALGDRNWEAMRDSFAPDLVFVDHRPLGLGALDREQWIASMQAGDELGDGVVVEVFRVLAWSEQGHVVAVRRFGTIADGGGPFEVDAILTTLVAEGRIRRIEVFDEADAERAVARFEELGAQAGS